MAYSYRNDANAAATAKASEVEQFAKSTTAVHTVKTSVPPKHTRHNAANTIRIAMTATLLLAATGTAEWHPFIALLLALATIPVSPLHFFDCLTRGDVIKILCSMVRRKSMGPFGVTASHEPLAASSLNH